MFGLTAIYSDSDQDSAWGSPQARVSPTHSLITQGKLYGCWWSVHEREQVAKHITRSTLNYVMLSVKDIGVVALIGSDRTMAYLAVMVDHRSAENST